MVPLGRRRFLAWCSGTLATAAIPARSLAREPSSSLVRQAPVARWWLPADGDAPCASCHDDGRSGEHDHDAGLVQCLLCARRCAIPPGRSGACGARYNDGGTLRSLVYGRPITTHVDPIEKKPFFHFLPGQTAFSLATSGCPLSCRFCQNWQISQAEPGDYTTPRVGPGEVASRAARREAPVIAFTYNEPTVFAEYMVDIARAGREAGLHSVMVSCGYAASEPLAELCGVLDAVKIDLKGFSESFYREVAGAELEPVLRAIRQVHASGIHLELVNLVVPGLNDSPAMLQELSRWVLGELGPDVPLHFTRFHPDFQLRDLPPTPVSSLERARDTAMELGLRYVYVGNVPGHEGNHTWCPGCGQVVLRRQGFFLVESRLEDGRCAECGREIAGVWAPLRGAGPPEESQAG